MHSESDHFSSSPSKPPYLFQVAIICISIIWPPNWSSSFCPGPWTSGNEIPLKYVPFVCSTIFPSHSERKPRTSLWYTRHSMTIPMTSVAIKKNALAFSLSLRTKVEVEDAFTITKDGQERVSLWGSQTLCFKAFLQLDRFPSEKFSKQMKTVPSQSFYWWPPGP